MSLIRIHRAPSIPADDLAVELRSDLPFHDARRAAIEAFEAAYLAALFRCHADLEAASRASGIAAGDLVTLRGRFARGTGVHRLPT